MPLMAIIFGDLSNTFGGLQHGAPGITTFQTVEAFSGEVSRLTLDFVYIGIGVSAATFFGTLTWIIGGERITRRIRMYVVRSFYFNIRMYLQAVLRQNVAFFDRLGAGEVTNRVSNDAEFIRAGISDKVCC